MSFHPERFPTGVSKRSRGGPTFRNSAIRLDSGGVQRIGRWDRPKWMFDAKYGIRDFDDGGTEDLDSVYEFWLNREGSLHDFLYKDWYDYTSAANHRGTPSDTDVLIGVGDGSEDEFQLIKVYTQGAYTFTRNIVRPVESSVVASVNDVGTSAFTMSDGGIIKFNTPPGAFNLKAGFDFDVQAHFSPEMDDSFSIGYDAYLAGEIPSIPIEESIDDLLTPHRYWAGGGDTVISSADLYLQWAHGMAPVFVPTAAHSLMMPDPTNLEPGGPYHVITNGSPTYTITVRDFGDTTTLATLTAGQTCITFLYLDSSVKTWGATA